MVNDTTRLLGLQGLAVTEVLEADPASGSGPVVYLETADERARLCPACGMRAVRVKEWVTTHPRDLPVAGRCCALRWRKRRWHCDQDSCPRGSFTEQVAQVPARARLTGRLRRSCGAAVADRGRTVVQSGRDHGVSWPIVCASFLAHAARVLPVQPDPVRVLGIDEVYRGRPHWVLDETSGRWHTTIDRRHRSFVDLSSGQGLLGQVEGRRADVVIAWLNERGPAWTAGVEVVAIDMSTVFKAAERAALPQATLVVDHFHLLAVPHAALTEVRRRVTLRERGHRGRKGNREWELRNRLTRSAARMHCSQLDPMVDDLLALPRRIGRPILAAWNAKEDLHDLLALARTHPDRHVIANRLFHFYVACADSGLAELERLATTVETWWPEILAFLKTGITNAGTEATNRVTKTIGRDAYGFRNPDNQRLRTRCATTRRHRGFLNPV